MREGKALKRAHREQQEHNVVTRMLNQYIEKTVKSLPGSKSVRMPLNNYVRIAFAPTRNTHDLAAQFNCSRQTVRMFFEFVAAVYLQVHLIILGCLMVRADVEKPLIVGTRLIWDETGQQLTATLPTGREATTYHIMVARLRLLVCWGAREVYSLVVVSATPVHWNFGNQHLRGFVLTPLA